MENSIKICESKSNNGIAFSVSMITADKQFMQKCCGCWANEKNDRLHFKTLRFQWCNASNERALWSITTQIDAIALWNSNCDWLCFRISLGDVEFSHRVWSHAFRNMQILHLVYIFVVHSNQDFCHTTFPKTNLKRQTIWTHWFIWITKYKLNFMCRYEYGHTFKWARFAYIFN